MEGVLYLTDEHSKRRFVQLDLDIHGAMWEDFYDGYMAELAKDDEMIPLREIIEEFKSKGILEDEL